MLTLHRRHKKSCPHPGLTTCIVGHESQLDPTNPLPDRTVYAMVSFQAWPRRILTRMAANEWQDHPIRSTICVLLTIALGLWFYTGDEHGFHSHDAEVSIATEANWFIGESKNCASIPLSQADEHHRVGYALTDLNCDDKGTPHLMNVTFWGREEQPEYELVMWKCQRDEKEFTCKELLGFKK
jgi:hypothetical protein